MNEEQIQELAETISKCSFSIEEASRAIQILAKQKNREQKKHPFKKYFEPKKTR